MSEQTAAEIVESWPEEKQIEVAKKLVSIARHGVNLSFPNLATLQQVEDMRIMINSLEEGILAEAEEFNGLEDLPEMTPEQEAGPESEPKSN